MHEDFTQARSQNSAARCQCAYGSKSHSERRCEVLEYSFPDLDTPNTHITGTMHLSEKCEVAGMKLYHLLLEHSPSCRKTSWQGPRGRNDTRSLHSFHRSMSLGILAFRGRRDLINTIINNPPISLLASQSILKRAG